MTTYESTYRSSWLSPAPAPIDDYFSSTPGITTHDFLDSDSTYQPSEDRGTPTVGIYATDGIWDEEDSTEINSARYSSAAASSIKTKGGSVKTRSTRSGTVSPYPGDEEKGGMWAWARRAGRESPVVEKSPESGLRKRESKAKLRGKGRRGELVVVVDPEECATPPVPPTPASYLQTPVTGSPAFFSPQQHASQHDETDAPGSSKPKASWKRGMQRIFRSKSSAALREISNNSSPVPPTPQLPQKHALGKPFSASTPPAAILPKRVTRTTGEDNAQTPKTARSDSFGLFPDFPADPFESRLDIGSKGMQTADQPVRSKIPRHSPSMKSLKDFINPKPKLSKTKSMAILREPTSAPPTTTEFPPIPLIPRRMASMTSLGQNIRQSLGPTAAPVESPPLLPPNPPYFPISASFSPAPSSSNSSAPSLSISTSLPISVSSSAPMSPPPDTPLPPIPIPTSQPVVSSDMSRSASGHKLLPRSRSTSMSLRSPPTSSSFFDLYEQLGIWPTPEKNKDGEEKVKPESGKPASEEPGGLPAKLDSDIFAPLSNSSSGGFSPSSWEATLNAFPVVETQAAADVKRDSTHAGDNTVESVLSNMAVAASGSTTRSNTVSHASEAGPSRSQVRTSQPLQPTPRGRSRRSGEGSGSSSREDSRNRRPSLRKEGQWDGDYSSDGSSSEEDDVPLSKLHPEALAAQQEKKARSARKKEIRAKAKANQVKLVGRNPGGGTGWNGEGGVPARFLAERLERLLLAKPSPLATTPSDYPWAASSRSRPRDMTGQSTVTHQMQPHQRSQTEPVRSGSHRHPARPVIGIMTASPQLMNDDRVPSPMLASAKTVTGPRPSDQMSRHPSSASTHTQTHHRLPPVPDNSSTPSASLSRSNTTASKRSVSRQRSRSNSTARHGLASDENMIKATAAAEPMPAMMRTVHIRAFIGSLEGKKVTLEVLPETTAGEVLAGAVRNGELGDLARGMSWVIVEMFAEIGCERLIREYEQLQTVTRGWDATNKYNCLIIKQTNQGSSTSPKTIPQTAPFVGSWVQYESKKGKWSKRWLETRGGQVFLAKNEKNKDEAQINTLFFDVYHMTRPYPGPKPFVFVVKRMEPESAFENPEEYIHTISAEEGVGYKLISAIFDAKSFALRPHVLARQAQTQPIVRKPTLPMTGPLVDIKKNVEEKTGFTGKGLLRL